MTTVSDAELFQVPSADPVPAESLPADPAGQFMANWVAEPIHQRSLTTARSLSRKVGPSGLGTAPTGYAAPGSPPTVPSVPPPSAPAAGAAGHPGPAAAPPAAPSAPPTPPF